MRFVLLSDIDMSDYSECTYPNKWTKSSDEAREWLDAYTPQSPRAVMLLWPDGRCEVMSSAKRLP